MDGVEEFLSAVVHIIKFLMPGSVQCFSQKKENSHANP